MNIVFLGPPGSGKGTQALMLEKQYNLVKISTGDLLRKEISNETEIGNKIKTIINSGSYAPDEIVIEILNNEIIAHNNSSKGFILDGFPRTLKQATALDLLLEKLDKKIEIVLALKLDQQFLIDRISGRFSCLDCGAAYNEKFKNTRISGICDECGGSNFACRKDDNIETVSQRLKIYHHEVAPLVDYYNKKQVLYEVDGNAEIDVVNKKIKLIVESSLIG
jgi:adenylate kinase